MVGIGFGISVIGCEFDEDVSNVSLVCQRKEGSFRLSDLIHRNGARVR